MKRRGFSIVELAIVIAMIGILSLLLFAGLRSSQTAARDDERRAKAEIIANSLESLYKNGNSNYSYQPGKYPNITTLNTSITSDYAVDFLPGVDSASLDFTWTDDGTVKLKTLLAPSEADNRANTEKMTFIEPRVDVDEFVYEPLMLSSASSATDNDQWVYCKASADRCRKFNLYYRTEADNTVHVIRSINQ